ncbi:MAG: hypothetical protein AB7E77_06525 [Desulfobulbus sp.]
MKNDDRSGGVDDELLMELSADMLRGRQSVRATFRLPSQLIALLSLAANQLGLKQKSLFDQLVEDREVLTQLAQMADQYQPVDEQRRQKTYVVSRNALSSLEFVAKSCGLPRDLLVELSIQRLVPVLSLEQEKQRKRKQILNNLQAFCRQGDLLWQETVELLGDGDPAIRAVAELQLHCQRAVDEMIHLVEQGKELEQSQ